MTLAELLITMEEKYGATPTMVLCFAQMGGMTLSHCNGVIDLDAQVPAVVEEYVRECSSYHASLVGVAYLQDDGKWQ